mgnify:CR=1 FL=1
MSECRVALLAGGKSGEREVSLASAEGAREALEEAGYTVTQLDPADKEDLKRLIDGPFDVLFSVCMGNMGKTAPCRVFWKRSGSLISVAGYGRALWQWIK